jgi:hypothetical protein
VIVESTVVFVLLLAVALLFYLVCRRVAPKAAGSRNERFCAGGGEFLPQKLGFNITVSRCLPYSSHLLLAFATLFTGAINMPVFLLYMGIMVVSGLLVMEGGKER